MEWARCQAMADHQGKYWARFPSGESCYDVCCRVSNLFHELLDGQVSSGMRWTHSPPWAEPAPQPHSVSPHPDTPTPTAIGPRSNGLFFSCNTSVLRPSGGKAKSGFLEEVNPSTGPRERSGRLQGVGRKERHCMCNGRLVHGCCSHCPRLPTPLALLHMPSHPFTLLHHSHAFTAIDSCSHNATSAHIHLHPITPPRISSTPLPPPPPPTHLQLATNGAERRRYYCNALPASHTLVS